MAGNAYLLEMCRYVDLNPVPAGMIDRPEHWLEQPSCAWGLGSEQVPVWPDSSVLARQSAPRAHRREGP